MSTNDHDERADARTDDRPRDSDPDVEDRDALVARLELLAEENRRLRAEYARARQARYRRTALGLGGLGVLAVLGAVVVPAGAEVLFALGATGLFGGVLTYYLSPGRFVAADVGERVYAAMAANLAAIADELGLRDRSIYAPGEDESTPAQLFVPRSSEFSLPADGGPIVVAEESRGLLLEPTGAPLFAEFERGVSGDVASAPGTLATQLADGLVEDLELAGAADPDVDVADDGGRVTVAITDSAVGDVDRFDHPIASFLAVGIAAGLDRPVELKVGPGDDRTDWLVTCRWDESDAAAGEA